MGLLERALPSESEIICCVYRAAIICRGRKKITSHPLLLLYYLLSGGVRGTTRQSTRRLSGILRVSTIYLPIVMARTKARSVGELRRRSLFARISNNE